MRICARLGSTGFNLCSVDLLKLKPHMQKPVLLDRTGTVL
jgi:hypothetical protein